MSLSLQSGLVTPGILVAVTPAEAALYAVGAQYPDSRAERPTTPAGGAFPVPQTSGQGPYNYVPGFLPLAGATVAAVTGGVLSSVRSDVDSALDFALSTSASLSYDLVNQSYGGVIGAALGSSLTLSGTSQVVTAGAVGLNILAPAISAGFAKYQKFTVVTERAVPNGLFPQGTQGAQFPTPSRSTFLNTEADLVCDLVLLSAAGVIKDVIKPYIFRNMENLSDRGASRFAGCYEFLYPLHNAAGVAGALSPVVAGDTIAVRLSHPVSPKAGIAAPQGRFRVYLTAQSN